MILSKRQNKLLRRKLGALGIMDTDGWYSPPMNPGQQMVRSTYAADHTLVCGRPLLCGQGNYCILKGMTLFLPVAKTSCHPPVPILPSLLLVITSPHTWSFSGHNLSRDYIYHPAFQVSVTMILNYLNGEQRDVYTCASASFP